MSPIIIYLTGLLINNSIPAGFVLARELLLLLICRLRSKVGTFVPRAMCSGRNYEQLPVAH